MITTARAPLPVTPDALAAYLQAPSAFARLTPPWRTAVDRTPGCAGIAPGDERVFDVDTPLGMRRWRAVHDALTAADREAVQAPAGAWGFVDAAAEGPFAHFRHAHLVLPTQAGASMVDRVAWRAPLGLLGKSAHGMLARDLHHMFAWRARRIAHDLRVLAWAPRPLCVAITGATGMVGTALTALCVAGGHRVVHLTRGPPRSDTARMAGVDARRFLDGAGPATGDVLHGVDVVVHLAGASISARWTTAHKKAIRDSRVDGTAAIAQLVAREAKRAGRAPVLVSASAVGYYGHRTAPVNEPAAPGEGFLSSVCQAWETAADPARTAGARVVHARLGVVLDPRGGALAKMLPAFRAGAGGPLGSGRQHLPWVSLDDAVAALWFLATHPVEGPVNVVAPEVCTQRAFARALGTALGRPAVVPTPGFAVRAMFGEMGQALLLEGAPVEPGVLTAADPGAQSFTFEDPTLLPALRVWLGKTPAAATLEVETAPA